MNFAAFINYLAFFYLSTISSNMQQAGILPAWFMLNITNILWRTW
jgi:hypothetical protein